MTRPLSMDLRSRLVSVAAGMSRRAAAERFGVAPSTAIKWLDLWERTGDVVPRPQGGDHRSRPIEAHAKEVLGLIEARRDITLAEIAEHLDRVHGLKRARSTVWRLLDRHGMTFKKMAHANEQQRTGRGLSGGADDSQDWMPALRPG